MVTNFANRYRLYELGRKGCIAFQVFTDRKARRRPGKAATAPMMVKLVSENRSIMLTLRNAQQRSPGIDAIIHLESPTGTLPIALLTIT